MRMLAWSIAAAVTAVAIFSGATWQTPWRDLVEPFTISLIFTAAIVPLCAITMPRLVPAVGCRFSFPFDWVVIAAVMVVLALVGSGIAIAILRVVGYIPPGDVWRWFAGSLRTSIVMTLIFGVSISAIEQMRARLADTAMALRTKERDEADARRMAAEAQLAALENRVQPHFLFNTLNSIAALVHDDPARAERMTTELASLLRSSLDQQGSPLVPLAEELHVVRDYLEIERVRFGDRLRYTIQIDEAWSASRVPRLAVQTLVENSVKYAVAPRREGGTIAIHASGHRDRVQIEVRDDGPGFDSAPLQEGHGLELLRGRLAMLFGDSASLHIASTPGSTRITLDLPHMMVRDKHARVYR
jgi:two-component system sensor histidine kinase AlgZ